MLHSVNDKYYSIHSCMLEDILKHNKLIYIYVGKGTNIVKKITLS